MAALEIGLTSVVYMTDMLEGRSKGANFVFDHFGYRKHEFCMSSRIYRAQVITYRHRTRAAAIQSAETVPSRLQSVTFW